MNKMDLNKLSFNELKKQMEEIETTTKTLNKPKGLTYCIIRTYSAGVFAGLIDRTVKGMEGTIYDSRRLWYWDGAASLSQLANDGVKNPDNCKFSQTVEEIDLKEIIEIIPCKLKAEKCIKQVIVWEK